MRSREVHALGQRVAAGDRDDEAQVGADEPILCFGCFAHLALQRSSLLASVKLLGRLAASLDDAREFTLVFGSEQRHLADVIEVQTDGIIHVFLQPFNIVRNSGSGCARGHITAVDWVGGRLRKQRCSSMCVTEAMIAVTERFPAET